MMRTPGLPVESSAPWTVTTARTAVKNVSAVIMLSNLENELGVRDQQVVKVLWKNDMTIQGNSAEKVAIFAVESGDNVPMIPLNQ